MALTLTLELHQLPKEEVRRGWVRIHESQRRGIRYGELIEIRGQAGAVLRVVYGLPPGYSLSGRGAAANWVCMDEPTRQKLGFGEGDLGSKVAFSIRQYPRWSRWTKWICYALLGRYQEAVRRGIEGIGDPSARLAEALRAITEVMDAHQEDLLILYRESHALDRKSLQALLARVEEFIQFLEQILSAAHENGHAAIGNLTLAANIVTFLPTIVALRRWDLKRKVPKDEMIRGLVDFMMRGLGAKE